MLFFFSDRKILKEILAEVKLLKERLKDMAGEIKRFSDAVSASFDALHTQVDGVADDVTFLKEKIEELQNNPGTITPEDQARIFGKTIIRNGP